MSDTKTQSTPDERAPSRRLSLDQKVHLAALLIFVALPSLLPGFITLLTILIYLTGGPC